MITLFVRLATHFLDVRAARAAEASMIGAELVLAALVEVEASAMIVRKPFCQRNTDAQSHT